MPSICVYLQTQTSSFLQEFAWEFDLFDLFLLVCSTNCVVCDLSSSTVLKCVIPSLSVTTKICKNQSVRLFKIVNSCENLAVCLKLVCFVLDKWLLKDERDAETPLPTNSFSTEHGGADHSYSGVAWAKNEVTHKNGRWQLVNVLNKNTQTPEQSPDCTSH